MTSPAMVLLGRVGPNHQYPTGINGPWVSCAYSVSRPAITTGTLLTPVRFDSGRSCEFISAMFVIVRSRVDSLVVAWSRVRFVSVLHHPRPIANVFERLCTLPAQGTLIIFTTGCLLSRKLSLFSQALLVTHRRFKIPPIYWAAQVLDHTHATNYRNNHVLHVISRRKDYPKCEKPSSFTDNGVLTVHYSQWMIYISCRRHSPGWFSSQLRKVRGFFYVSRQTLTTASDIAVDGTGLYGIVSYN